MSGGKRVFVVHAPIRDITEYEKLAQLSTKLKPHGRVEVNVSSLAEKTEADVPEGGSPWHEYASYNPTPLKFFPPEKLAPFLSAEHVAKNREILDAKREILRKHELGAAFWSYEPNFLPEAFYEKYPHLRGARSDHPRRSRKEAFSPCVDRPETLEMFEESIAALVAALPELRTYFFKTNDAGPGFCWSQWLYSGANGPSFCKHRPMGERIRGFLDALNRGAGRSGAKLDLHLSGNFDERERDDIAAHLPKNATLRRRSKRSVSVGSGISGLYPVRCLFNPLRLLGQLQSLRNPELTTIFVDFRSSYDRGYEHLEAAEKVIECIADFAAKPAYGTLAVVHKLHDWCERWAGAKNAERLFEALMTMNDVLRHGRTAFPELRPIHCGTSSRFINRPLVIMPEKLSPEEEVYFLPHVFNIHETEARMDYADTHGGRSTPSIAAQGSGLSFAVQRWRRNVEGVCRELEALEGAPEAPFFGKVAIALRILASLMRSGANFFTMQALRDRNADRLSGPETIPSKTGSWEGDADLLLMNECMRDELDNAAELTDLLEAGGMELVCHNDCGEDEDTFLLSSELPSQIRTKMKIMRDHWLDAQHYLASPMK